MVQGEKNPVTRTQLPVAQSNLYQEPSTQQRVYSPKTKYAVEVYGIKV
jgi:hypothetical protein